MGLRDAEEMLEAAKSDNVQLEQENARLRQELEQLRSAPPIPEGWQIVNGWVCEPLADDQRAGVAPDEMYEPLFDLRMLPGWSGLVRAIRADELLGAES